MRIPPRYSFLKPRMPRASIVSVLPLLLVALALDGSCPARAQNGVNSNAASLIETGRYLAVAADCIACHTVPKVGKPFAGGYAIVSPLGPIYSSNITPSKTAGIGNYTEQQFSKAVREGIRADGAHLYPAMPYTSYTLLSDQDVKALYAYFMHGVKAVDTPAPKIELPVPFNIRASMIGWNWLFLEKHRYAENPSVGEEVNRGNYLANALGHCGACHTPRNFLMAEQRDKAFGGAVLGNWYAPDISADRVGGIGGWTDAELVQYLRTGHVDGKGDAAGPMAQVVQDSLQHLSQKDLEAIVAYLRTVGPVNTPQDAGPAYAYGHAAGNEATMRGDHGPNERNSLTTGAALYSGYCASCHQARGTGSDDKVFPALYHNTATGEGYMGTATNLIATILFGVDRRVGTTHTLMPGFGIDSYVTPLSNEQIASISNYVLAQYGNPALHVTSQQVAQARKGGPKVLLARMQPYIVPLCACVVVLIAVLLWVVFVYRRKRGKPGESAH